MAILLSDFVWEGTSVEPRPTDAEGARDGHIIKELDTGESYIRRSGVWTFINLGLSFIKATKSGRITTDADGQYHVSFVTPFINNEYTVAMSCEDRGQLKPVSAYFSNIAIEGFDIQTREAPNGQAVGSIVVSWLATRNYNP